MPVDHSDPTLSLTSIVPPRSGTRFLVVTFPPSATFKRRKAQDREYCEALADAVRAVTGARVSLRCELGDEEGATPAQDGLSEEELVARFVAEFDAEELPADNPED